MKSELNHDLSCSPPVSSLKSRVYLFGRGSCRSKSINQARKPLNEAYAVLSMIEVVCVLKELKCGRPPHLKVDTNTQKVS